jgi:hypothetical protein
MRMAISSGQATARKDADLRLQPAEKPHEKSQLEKNRISKLEDRIDFRAVRHARTLAAKRGEQPMAWEDFKKTL